MLLPHLSSSSFMFVMLRIRSQCDTFLYDTTAHAGKYPMEQYSCILRGIRPSLDGWSYFIQLELKKSNSSPTGTHFREHGLSEPGC